MLALLVLPAASAAAWFGFFKLLYGTFSPAAPYGHYTQTALAYAPVGLQGLLFDQQFGLMPTAPMLVAALVGFVALVRTRWRLALELFALVACYSVAAARYRMWWGGWSAPARLVVAVLPVLAVPAAVWWSSLRPFGRLAGGTLLGLGILASATELLVGRGRLIFNPRDAVSRLYEWLSPLVEVDRALPSSFRTESAPALLLAAIWTCALVAGIAAVSWGVRRSRGGGLALRCSATVASAVVAATVALEVCWRIQDVRPIGGATSRLNVVDAAAAPAHLGVSYAPFGFDSPARLVTRLRLSQSMRRPLRETDPAFQLAPVPPGVYRLVDAGLASSTATLAVRIGRGESPVETWPIGPATRTVERTLRLPCAVNAVIMDAGAAARPPCHASRSSPCRSGLAMAARKPRLIAVFDTAAPRSSSSTAARTPRSAGSGCGARPRQFVAVMPDGAAAAVTLEVRGGAAGLRVRLDSGSWRSDLALQANELQAVQVPLDRRTGTAFIKIRPDNGFVPSSVDPASKDRRFLGCWITVPE